MYIITSNHEYILCELCLTPPASILFLVVLSVYKHIYNIIETYYTYYILYFVENRNIYEHILHTFAITKYVGVYFVASNFLINCSISAVCPPIKE